MKETGEIQSDIEDIIAVRTRRTSDYDEMFVVFVYVFMIVTVFVRFGRFVIILVRFEAGIQECFLGFLVCICIVCINAELMIFGINIYDIYTALCICNGCL